MPRYPPSGIRCARYSTVSAPRSSGLTAGCCLKCSIRSLGVRSVLLNSLSSAPPPTDSVSVPGDQAVDHRLGHDGGTCLFRLLREPRVEARPQDRVGMRMGAVAEVLVVEADRGLR